MGKYKYSNNTVCKRNSSVTRSPKNEWWDEDCRQAIKQKNITRMKCLQQKTRDNQEH